LDINLLQHIESWQWPPEASAIILNCLRDRRAKASERVAAAELAGDLVVMNDRLAGALITVLGDDSESVELRAQAAISLGPVLEQTDIDGFDEEPFIDEPAISEGTFEKILELLRRIYSDPDAPKEVRRRVLEAAVRAPQDWHRNAIRKAYDSADREWKLTAVFGMRYVSGFDAQILDALNSKDEEIHFEAVQGAGARELESAWPHVKSLVQSSKTNKDLLLAAIEAIGTIRPGEAREVLDDLTGSQDEEIAEAADEAIQMAEARLAGESEDEDEAF
jgi:uncharacterized protein (UPF0147 family)